MQDRQGERHVYFNVNRNAGAFPDRKQRGLRPQFKAARYADGYLLINNAF
jgi:hypothetical protein